MNRCDIGSDGKTPLQRLHVRRDNGKWEPRFHRGVFVGLLNSSSEAVVVTEQGTAIKTRSANIRRIPVGEMGRGQNTGNASRPMVSGWK